MFDVIILCAGRGTRMGRLTEYAAKPSLEIESESLISRLVTQVSNLPDVNKIYINCSYQAFSIVDSLRKFNVLKKVEFLWEKKQMGTSWSILKIVKRSQNDVLVLHGDLFLSQEGLNKFVSFARINAQHSSLAAHERLVENARSKIEFDSKSHMIKTFTELSLNHSIKIEKGIKVWSNSGIYFFVKHHLVKLDEALFINKNIPGSILPTIIRLNELRLIKFEGLRFSIETEFDLNRVRQLKKSV